MSLCHWGTNIAPYTNITVLCCVVQAHVLLQLHRGGCQGYQEVPKVSQGRHTQKRQEDFPQLTNTQLWPQQLLLSQQHAGSSGQVTAPCSTRTLCVMLLTCVVPAAAAAAEVTCRYSNLECKFVRRSCWAAAAGMP